MGFIQTNSYLINVSHIINVKHDTYGKAVLSLSNGRKLVLTCNYNEVLVAICDAREGLVVNVEYFDE